MKRTILCLTVSSLCLTVLAVTTGGCVASSHMTLGSATAHSSVAAHEWRDTDFYAEDGKVGSTLGFLSSEVGVGWNQCEEMSIGASISWNQDEVAAYPDSSGTPMPPVE